MKRRWAIAILLALATATWSAEPPTLVNYKGVLRNADDSPRNGSHDMVFHFFDAEVGGTELLTEQHAAASGDPVMVTGGLFDVQLGSGTIIGPGTYGSLSGLFRDHGEVWLEVQVGTEVLSPRVQVLAAAFALNADRLDGRDAAFFEKGIDLAGHGSSSFHLLHSTSTGCLSGDLPKECAPEENLLLRIPTGSEQMIEGVETASGTQQRVWITLTGHGMPEPPALPDSCHPGVEVTIELGGTPSAVCLSPAVPVRLIWSPVVATISLHPGSWVALNLREFEYRFHHTFESDGRIAAALVNYLPDGTSQVDVGLMNNGPVRASYIVEITDCSIDCTEPPPGAQTITKNAIPFDPHWLTFDLPRCGGAVGTNQCTVWLMSPTGRLYHSLLFSF